MAGPGKRNVVKTPGFQVAATTDSIDFEQGKRADKYCLEDHFQINEKSDRVEMKPKKG